MKLPPLTIIPAGAGSGKTYTIQTKLGEWVKKKIIRPERIVAVTFTEAAANELRERIRFSLLEDPKVSMEQVLALDQAYITTIHSFGLRLLQEYCFAGGWSPESRLLNEDEGDILIRRALAITRKADVIMADLDKFGYRWDYVKGTPEDQFWAQLSRLMQKHRILGLNGIDRRITIHLKRRIKKLYGRTGRAAEMDKRLQDAVKKLLKKFPDSLADSVSDNATYHKEMSDAYRNLLKARKKAALSGDWALWVNLQNLRMSKRGSKLPAGYDDLAKAVMSAAKQLYRHPGPLEEALLHAESLVGAAQDCLQHHTRLKRNRSLVDYGDMLSLSHELLTNTPYVLQDLSDRVDCVVIDEFQDTNPLQFSLLWALYRQGIPTMVVGDVKQAIMGFQDADSRLLEALEKSEKSQLFPLKENYRTVKPLMKFLNAAGKGLFPATYQELTPKVTGKSKFEPLHIINFSKYNSHLFYGAHIAAHIKSILKSGKKVLEKDRYRPVQGRDIAILLPTHTMIEQYAESFRAAGLQVQIEEKGWFESRSVQLLYYAILYVADPNDRHAALYLSVTELGQGELENSVKTLIDGKFLNDPILTNLSALHKADASCDVYSQVSAVVAALELFASIANWPDAAQQRANVLRFLAEAEEFTTINPETLAAGGLYGFGLKTFLAWLLKRQNSDNTLPRTRVIDHDAVTLSTWHSAKGREWPIVAVCGTFKDYDVKLPSLNIEYQNFTNLDDILKKAVIEFSPEFNAGETRESFKQPLQVEAEKNARRLLYVAMTRAKEQLILERPGYQEGKDKLSYWSLLSGCTKMSIADKSITIGKRKFICTQTTIGKEEADIDDNLIPSKNCSLPSLGIRAIKPQSLPELTPETLSPSQISKSKVSKTLQVTTSQYGTVLDIDLKRDPAATGVILHRCFEVLSGQSDRSGLLEAATGYEFSKKQKKDLQAAVKSFEIWCRDNFGDIEMHKEIPVTYQKEDGVLVSGIIDLLLETDAGYWIIDHKTHKPDNPEKNLWDYWPQLQAYQDGVEKSPGTKKVLGVGVNWIRDGAVSLVFCSRKKRLRKTRGQI